MWLRQPVSCRLCPAGRVLTCRLRLALTRLQLHTLHHQLSNWVSIRFIHTFFLLFLIQRECQLTFLYKGAMKRDITYTIAYFRQGRYRCSTDCTVRVRCNRNSSREICLHLKLTQISPNQTFLCIFFKKLLLFHSHSESADLRQGQYSNLLAMWTIKNFVYPPCGSNPLQRFYGFFLGSCCTLPPSFMKTRPVV